MKNPHSSVRHAGDEPSVEQTRQIAEALRRHVDPRGQPIRITSTPVEPGMSGAAIRRHFVEMDGDDRVVSLISKETTLVERRVLALLQDQGQTSVPFNYSSNLVNDVVDVTWMEDLGNEHRPTSLDHVPGHVITGEARALARLHHANGGHPDDLAWLPRVDRRYVHDTLTRTWAPAWARAVESERFRQEFGVWIALVEAAAANVAEEVGELADHPETLTLIHGDINPSNVLITDGEPRFIDWQAACLAPFYLDLPHHLCSLEMAETYRCERADLGDAINLDDFVAGYRIASHYIGLRYIWWTLDLWQQDPTQSRWVRFYLDMIGR